MKQKQTCAQGAGRVLRGQGCCLLVVRSVLSMMCPADGQQKDDEKGQTEDKPKMRAETKPKKTRVDSNEVVGFR